LREAERDRQRQERRDPQAELRASRPRLGRAVPEAQDENIRELLRENYRIIYRIICERIEILTVVHASRERTRQRFSG
jgi:plasmid stabilization system protein ParE